MSISDLQQFGPLVVIVGLFLGFMLKITDRFIKTMEIKDVQHREVTNKFIEITTKISEYMPRLVTALEEYNKHFPLIYQKNLDLSSENLRLRKESELHGKKRN